MAMAARGAVTAQRPPSLPAPRRAPVLLDRRNAA
jgi:hypothetical protein